MVAEFFHMDDFVPLANTSRFLGDEIGLKAAFTVAVLMLWLTFSV